MSESEQTCPAAVLRVPKSFIGPHCSRSDAMYQVRTGKNVFCLKLEHGQRDLIFSEYMQYIMRKIHGPIKNRDGSWGIRNNEEIDLLIKHADVVRYIKTQSIRWFGRIVRMDKGR